MLVSHYYMQLSHVPFCQWCFAETLRQLSRSRIHVVDKPLQVLWSLYEGHKHSPYSCREPVSKRADCEEGERLRGVAAYVPSICQATWQCIAQMPGLSAMNRITRCEKAGIVTVSLLMGFSRFHLVLSPRKTPSPQPTIWNEWPVLFFMVLAGTLCKTARSQSEQVWKDREVVGTAIN